ncbi:vacuolar protein sorting-associated protein 37B, partial [Rhincodon typus]|uniref:vacuolar protein sorting-associated protein 37B n=1 Tax=Rhincodon typus TaxID=259920 RepID=UPI00203000F5
MSFNAVWVGFRSAFGRLRSRALGVSEGIMSLPDLSSLSLQELNELLEDEGKLNKMAEGMEEVRNIQPNKDMSLASNRSLAEQNLEYHPKLDCLKIQLIRKYQELQTLFEAYQMRKSKLGNLFSLLS